MTEFKDTRSTLEPFSIDFPTWQMGTAPPKNEEDKVFHERMAAAGDKWRQENQELVNALINSPDPRGIQLPAEEFETVNVTRGVGGKIFRRRK